MGLRQRKKERMRDELAASACHLFTERGYEATTVEDIAAAVDVSPRTFFRYFPTKADVAAEILRTVGFDLVHSFAERPLTEPLLTSLRIAVRGPVDAHERNADQAARVLRMLCANPALRGRQAEVDSGMRDALAEQIALRLGVDATRDFRPRLVTDIVATALSSVADFWAATGGSADLGQLADAALDIVGNGLCSLPQPAAQDDTTAAGTRS